MILVIFGWIAIGYGSFCLACSIALVAFCAACTVSDGIRRRRADRAWAAGAAWRMHVLDVQAMLRDRDAAADFEEWADELCRGEPSP